MKARHFICLVWLLLILPRCFSQVISTENAYVIIGDSTVASFDGDVSLSTGFQEWNQQGTLFISGNLAGEDTDLIEGTGSIIMDGGGLQNISNLIFLPRLGVESGSNVLINSDIDIDLGIDLFNGNITIEDANIVLGTNAPITGAGPEQYIRTTGNGYLFRTGINDTLLFPVGTNTYTPARLAPLGDPQQYGVRVADSVFSLADSGRVIDAQTINKTWFVNTDTNVVPTDLILQWNSEDEGINFDRSRASIWGFDNNLWLPVGRAPLMGEDPFTLGEPGLTNLQAFTIADSQLFRFEWILFEGIALDDRIQLDWQTLELNTDSYVVERSFDGIEFIQLGSVDGGAQFNTSQSYTFDDLEPEFGINYYRIRHIDLDGAFLFSEVIQVRYPADIGDDLLIIPNPAPVEFTVLVPNPSEEESEVYLINDLGQKILLGSIPPGQISAKFQWGEGVTSLKYYIWVEVDGKEYSGKIVKY